MLTFASSQTESSRSHAAVHHLPLNPSSPPLLPPALSVTCIAVAAAAAIPDPFRSWSRRFVIAASCVCTPNMYRVRAVYDYSSPHEDDLSFKVGQIISVTEEEGDDWYVGEYIDDSGTKHDGLFPRNFVERYEPAPPPRPNRASRYKPVEQPAEQPAPPPPAIPQPEPEPEPVKREEPELPSSHAPPPPLEVPAAAKTVPLPMSPASPESASSIKAPEPFQPPTETVKPAPAVKKAPPPVAAKSNAFRDRIAAFNAPAAAPIQPFKPSGAPANFIKKPFVAPPPSRNAYVPPARETPQVKTYRREEDPEIAERQAQDNEAAEKAGLVAHDHSKANEGGGEEEQPKVSLKERIALLQKQQQEQAERAAAAMHKEKPKRPPVKKRTESREGHVEDSEDTGLERVTSGASKERVSMEHPRPRALHDVSDANDADQSGAGETEDAEGDSTSVENEEDRAKKHPSLPSRVVVAPAQEPDVADEQDAQKEGQDGEEEEEEEDEMDAETRRKLELRERMAKMSGGMGMPGMFGAMPMGGLPPKKKKPAEKRAEEDEVHSMPQQRVPMFPMPGLPHVRSPEPEERQPVVEKEAEDVHPITGTHAADEIADVEDLAPQPVERTPTGERPPPVPTDSKSLLPSKPLDVIAHGTLDCSQLSTSGTLSKTYVACDGFSEYVMTVSVSSMFLLAVQWCLFTLPDTKQYQDALHLRLYLQHVSHLKPNRYDVADHTKLDLFLLRFHRSDPQVLGPSREMR